MIKGILDENRVQTNKYDLMFQPGPGLITFTSIGSMEEELDASELPDRTVRSGGRKKPGTTDLVQPMHHDLEVLAMKVWWLECQDKVSPLHLKIGTLIIYDQSGLPRVRHTILNCWLSKRVLPDLELEGDGDMGTYTWTMNYDEIL